MAQILLPVGIESFSELRTNGRYYVDKTGFIEELLKDEFKVNLITRPRRFGKTLAMSMLADFFDIRQENHAIFEGLQITQNSELCSKWMNQYPVLFLTLKSAEGLDYNNAYEMLTAILSDWCIAHFDLLESPKITTIDKDLFLHLAKKSASLEEVKNSLYTLCRILKMHYGKPVILLIDEYDVPLAKANEHGFYLKMLDVIRGLLGKALKTNEFLKFAVITGCLRIAKESIFTGTNNFVSYSISDVDFSNYFGFTQKEVLNLLKEANLEHKTDIIKKWYNGYHFGKNEIYCPWDVLNYVRTLQKNPDALPDNYWKNTSHNSIIRSFIDRTDLAINDKFEILLSGGYIQEEIAEDLSYDILHSSESNLWSILYLTGYLTQAESQNNLSLNPKKLWLKIPNEEVKSIFADTIATWFIDDIKQMERHPLFDAFWNGNDEEITKFVTDILFSTISYFDYKEDYYHAFLVGIFTGAGYTVESNKEYGLGRPDIVVRDRENRRSIIIETKRSHKENQMKSDAFTALNQIDTKQYAKQFLKGYHTVLCYGAAFFEKECYIKKLEL